MTNTHKFAPLLGKRIRVTQMNDDGTVGAHFIATDGFITVTLSAQVEDGTEIITRNAFGQLCINEKMNPTFKRLDIEIEFCGVNPSLLSYVSNAVEYEDYAGDVAGFTIPEGEIVGQYALEVWTGLSGALNDTHANGYMLLPYAGKGNIDDIKVDGEDAIDFNLTGSSTRGGNQWGIGPYDVVMNGVTDDSGAEDSGGVAAPLPTALDPFDHFLLIDTAVAAPVVDEQPVAVP
jgi:hypothetical protein